MKKRPRSEREVWLDPRESLRQMLLLFSDLPLFTEQDLRDFIRKEFPDEVEEFMAWLRSYWVEKGREEGRLWAKKQMRTAVLGCLRRNLKRKAIVVSTAQREVIRKLPPDQLEELLYDLSDVTSVTDLDN